MFVARQIKSPVEQAKRILTALFSYSLITFALAMGKDRNANTISSASVDGWCRGSHGVAAIRNSGELIRLNLD